VCLLGSNLNYHAKPEKLRPSRDAIEIINDSLLHRKSGKY
jgi:hypothetical protein